MEEINAKINSLKFGASSRLKDGIILKNLFENNAAEFSLDLSDSMVEEMMNSGEENSDLDFGLLDNQNYTNLNATENITTKIPFDQLREKMMDVTEDGKIKKKVLKSGSGEVVPHGSIIYFHYNCYLEMQDIPFDSSYHRSRPTRAQLGVGSLYPGLEYCLLSMKLKENSQFLIDPEYAFGSMGCPPRIPPNATLLLEIELLKAVEGSDIDNSDALLEDKDSFQEACSRAKKYHMLGNDVYKKGDVFAAVDKYKRAENILHSCKMANDEEEALCRKLLFKIYVNLCVCYNNPKLLSPERVCIAAREAFDIEPEKARKSAKLYFHMGKAQMAFGSFNKAEKHLKTALSLEPDNRDVIDLLAVLQRKRHKYYEHEKLTYQKAFESKILITGNVEPPNKFEEILRNQLQELVDNKIEKVQLPERLTVKEKNLCKSISKEQGLKYEEVVICGKTAICIKK